MTSRILNCLLKYGLPIKRVTDVKGQLRHHGRGPTGTAMAQQGVMINSGKYPRRPGFQSRW
jgi:hypothetical protein